MPFFGNKFSPKKPPSRKKNVNLSKEIAGDLVSDQRILHLKLGDQEFVFENGEWVPESGRNSATHKSNQKLRRKVQELQDENNLLQLKYEMLLNMLTQVTAESHIQQKEIEKMRRLGGSKSKG